VFHLSRVAIAQAIDLLVRTPAPPIDPTQQRHPDGPEGGRWIWWKDERHSVPKGTVYRLLTYMWNRDSASYDALEHDEVFDSAVARQTVRSYTSKANTALPPGFPWRLSADSVTRQLCKVYGESLQNP
jgi:hypothetical protein